MFVEHLLDDERQRIHTEPADAELQPETHDPAHLAAHLGVRPIQVWLEFEEAVEIVLARLAVEGPRARLHTWENHALVPVLRTLFRPEVPRAASRLAAGACFSEPRVLVRGVVDHEIHQDPQAVLSRLLNQLHEVAARPVARVHAVEVADIVAVVPVRRRMERGEPDRIDAEVLEVLEPPNEPLEVADAVAARVEERLHLEAIDHRVLVPAVFDHRAPRTAGSTRSANTSMNSRCSGATLKR